MNQAELNSAFLDAAGRTSRRAMQQWLAQGADVNARTTTGRTALMRLGLRGERRPELVRLLLDHGADVSLTDRMRMTPLHHAAQRAGPATIRLLLDAGADPNPGDRRNRTPLWYAIRRRSVELMTLLLERGADPNARTDSQWAGPLLYWALDPHTGGGGPDVVRCLLEHGADPNARWSGRENLLYLAFGRRNEPAIRLLLDYGASVQPSFDGVPSSQPLIAAVYAKLPELVRELLERGADPNVTDNRITPLLCAALSDAADSVRILLEAGADPRFRFWNGEVLLEVVEKEGRHEMAHLLREALEVRK
jgi:uncharacterized protein